MRLAISSGVPQRVSRMPWLLAHCARSRAASSGLSFRLAISRSHLAKRSGVLMKPGITQLTRMLCGASSLASTFENRISADFAGPVQEDKNGGGGGVTQG